VALQSLLILLDYTAESALVYILVRELSQAPDKTDVWVTSATLLRIGLALLGLGGYFVFVHFARYPAEVRTAADFASLLLLVNAFRTPVAIFRAKLLMHYELFINLTTRLLEVLMVIGLIFYGGKLVHFFLARVASATLYTVLAWVLARSFFKPRFSLNLGSIWYLLLQSLPVGVVGLLLLVQFRVDILMVSFLCGPSAAGLYGAIAQLPEYSLHVSEILITTAFPVLSQFHAKSARADFQLFYQRTLNILMIVIIPVAMVVTLMPEETVRLIFGSKFIQAAPALQILIWVLVLLYFNALSGAAIVAINRQKSLVWIEVIDVVVYLTLNSLLIPRWNYMGAAVARVLPAMIGSFIMYRLVQRYVGVTLQKGTLMKIVLCSGLMAGGTLFLSRFNPALALMAGGILYLILLRFTCGVRVLKMDLG
jgi:O-antigen/teichoic acid export membrane protein